MSTPGALGLQATLELVTRTVTQALGFRVAVLNLVEGDDVVVVAVEGDASVRDELLGARQSVADWKRLLAASRPWDDLMFLDHTTVDYSEHPSILMWVPDLEPSDDPEAWHPDDALFAPLVLPDGELAGMLSVDLPVDGRRPGPVVRRALAAFGVTASLALAHARSSDEARRATRRFAAVFSASPIPVGVLGPDRTWVDVNPAFCRFLRRSREELLGRRPLELTHPDDVAASDAVSRSVRAGQPTEPLEKRYLLPDGDVVWGRLHLALLDDGSGSVVAQIEDVTARRRAEERLRHQAHHDALTGLPNRAATLRRLREALAADAGTGRLTTVFFCDVDRLKWLNDTHGHAAGDAYLRELARRLEATVGEQDTVGRLGGDEFVVVLPAVRAPMEAIGLAGRLIEAVRQPWRWESHVVTPSVSIGIAYTADGDGDDVTAEQLVGQADTAMYEAKAEERGGWHVYDATVRHAPRPHFPLRADLPAALAEGQFVLQYQPLVELASGHVVGHEALLRWRHPVRGLLQPGQFLDVVLDSEFESAVTEWSLHEACRVAVAHPDGTMSVNVSSVQLGRRDFPRVVAQALATSGLAADRLTLELTEDRLLARPDGPERLRALRDLGVNLAVDDFGAGYAGLQYVLRFDALTTLKLDRAFAGALGTTPAAAHVTASAVLLAERCGLDLVVEGVETAEQAERLRGLGVRYAQGYLFGRPADPPFPADVAVPDA